MGWVDHATGLDGLAPADRAALDRLPITEAPKGTVLFCPGDAARGFVVVLKGRVEVFLVGPNGREILLYPVEPGQSCVQSTLGLLGGDDYSGEAITTTECTLVLIPRDLFLPLMDRSTAFRQFVFASFANRMQGMMHLLEQVAFQKVESRLAKALLKRAENDAVMATHQELAVAIGSAREVVSRRLEAMAKRGFVRLDRGRVQLVDKDSLQALSQISPAV